MNRRNFFKQSTAAGLGMAGAPVLISCNTTETKAVNEYQPIKPAIDAPNGAIYIPAKAFNVWQQWKDYNHEEAERDLGYAASIGLDSLRIWVSYEYWEADPKHHEECLEHFLNTAKAQNIKIMPSLFDSCGVDDNPEIREDRNPETAVAICSPAWAIHRDRSRWKETEKFVNRFMEQHANDQRLLAIEIMNEPYLVDNRMAFSRQMFKTATEKRGAVPLTVGTSRNMEGSVYFMDLGLDILQSHYNFPASIEDFEKHLEKEKMMGATLERPIWHTEWQRLRPVGDPPSKEVPPEQRTPDYASLAPSVFKSGLGHFWWSLMLKPAYLIFHRKSGVINGLFHEDGTVYSLADARAVSQNPALKIEERRELPEIMKI